MKEINIARTDVREDERLAKKVILVDQDGVLADFEGEFLRRWRKNNPNLPYISLKKRKGFSISKDYPEEYRELVRAVYNSPGFIASLPPVTGAIEALRAMKEAGHVVLVCTSPLVGNKNCKIEKLDWVTKYLGEEWLGNLIITKDKTLIRGHFLIDDRPEITGLLKPTWEHVIFDAPYNRNIPEAKERRRLAEWEDWRKFFENNFPKIKYEKLEMVPFIKKGKNISKLEIVRMMERGKAKETNLSYISFRDWNELLSDYIIHLIKKSHSTKELRKMVHSLAPYFYLRVITYLNEVKFLTNSETQKQIIKQKTDLANIIRSKYEN